MRGSKTIIAAVVLLAGCASQVVAPSSPTVTRWEKRDISELIAAIGPYDTTSLRGDWRSYDWFRFGNCRLSARTSLDGKIEKVELNGMGAGCDVYLQRLNAG